MTLRFESRRKVSEASAVLFSGMRVLPPDRRDAMFAPCVRREVDDIADDPLELDEKRRLLAEWREEIEHISLAVPPN